LQDLVEPAADAPWAAMQLTLLAPAIRHFCGDLDAPGPGVLTADAARLRARLRSDMLAAIESRSQQAVDAAGGLPCGEYRALLQAAPREIVRAMLVGEP
jgi:hypothetical protein